VLKPLVRLRALDALGSSTQSGVPLLVDIYLLVGAERDNVAITFPCCFDVIKTPKNNNS